MTDLTRIADNLCGLGFSGPAAMYMAETFGGAQPDYVLSNVISPFSYGAVGNGVADDAQAINAAVQAVENLGGGIVQLGTSHAIGGTITVVGSNVVLKGWGGDDGHNVGTLGAGAGTILKWIGAAGGEMVRFSSVSDAGGQKSRGGGCRGIYFDANSLAARGLSVYSWNSGLFDDLHFKEFSEYGLGMNCVATLGDPRDPQQNIFRRVTARQLVEAGEAIKLSSDVIGANTSFNYFEDIDLIIKDGDGFALYSTDNNLFVRTRCFVASGGTGNGVVFYGSDADASDASRANVFLHYSKGPILSKGTSSFTYPANGNTMLMLDKDNGTPEPTIETGSSLVYSFTDGVDVYEAGAVTAFAPTVALARLTRDVLISRGGNVAAMFNTALELTNAGLTGAVVFRWNSTDPEFVLRSGTPGVTMLNTFTGLKVDGTQVLATQQAAVADATGGATVDTEARAAINALLARLRTHGLIET